MGTHGSAPFGYHASILAGLLVAGCIVGVVAGVDPTASGSTAALVIRLAAVLAVVVSLLALIGSVTALLRGKPLASAGAIAVNAVVFVIALAVAFSFLAGGSSPYRLLSFPT
ncbi:MAG: hypothetical protein EG823_07235 [Actinobacteria bacterium]|nr:hypothetical protein [Actinomycetota bacterium]